MLRVVYFFPHLGRTFQEGFLPEIDNKQRNTLYGKWLGAVKKVQS